MLMPMTGIETLRGNAHAPGTFACPSSAKRRGVQGGNKHRGPAFAGDGMA